MLLIAFSRFKRFHSTQIPTSERELHSVYPILIKTITETSATSTLYRQVNIYTCSHAETKAEKTACFDFIAFFVPLQFSLTASGFVIQHFAFSSTTSAMEIKTGKHISIKKHLYLVRQRSPRSNVLFVLDTNQPPTFHPHGCGEWKRLDGPFICFQNCLQKLILKYSQPK